MKRWNKSEKEMVRDGDESFGEYQQQIWDHIDFLEHREKTQKIRIRNLERRLNNALAEIESLEGPAIWDNAPDLRSDATKAQQALVDLAKAAETLKEIVHARIVD